MHTTVQTGLRHFFIIVIINSQYRTFYISKLYLLYMEKYISSFFLHTVFFLHVLRTIAHYCMYIHTYVFCVTFLILK